MSVDLESRLLQKQLVYLLVGPEKKQQIIREKQFSKKQVLHFLLVLTSLNLSGTVSTGAQK